MIEDEQAAFNLIEVDFDPFEDGLQIEKTILINEAQSEVWLSCTIGGDPANLAYNESISLDLKGSFNEDAFQKALNKVVQRHEALRSALSPNGEYFIIYEKVPFVMNEIDWTAHSLVDQKDKLAAFVAKEMSSPFLLEQTPLFRFHLHKLGSDHHYFTVVIHHIIADGWSLGILLEDLSNLYNGYLTGNSADLPPAHQISDYALEELRFSKSEAFRKTENYWLGLYQKDIPVLDIPTDFPRPVPRSYQANRLDQHMPAHLVDQLKILGAKSGCSFVNTLLAAFEVFLSFKTKQKDIVIGLPSAGQSATEMFQLIGHCVNLMPLRSQVDPLISFHTYLAQRKVSFFDAYDHQQISFGQLIKKLNLKRDPSRIPLVPVMFNIDMGMDSAISFDGLSHRLISNPRAYETFELFLNAMESQGSFVLEWTYNTQLFKASSIQSMMEEFENLLGILIAEPDETLKKAFPVANTIEAEKTSAVEVLQGSDQTFLNLIAKQCKLRPDQPAIVFHDSVLKYGALWEKSNQFAAFLQEQGVQTGDSIGLAVDRSAEMVIALLGILKSGAAYLPLDPEYPKERIEFMLEDSSSKILLSSKEHQGYYESQAREIVLEEVIAQLDQYPKAEASKISLGDLAYILYTSGSTGKPKGVKINHHNLVNLLASMRLSPGMNPNDRLLAITTISFDIAGLELYLPLISGAEILMADAEQARDGRLLLKLLLEKEITVMQATPSTWQMIIDSGWNEKLNLKVLVGGEALPKELADQLLKRSDAVWNMYGPTETTIWSTIKQITTTDGVITIGKPIHNTQIYILNDQLQAVQAGEIGEICIGGAGVALGYLNREDLNREKFIKDVYSGISDSFIYRTGDLGKALENGDYQCLGRIDQQVKIRGHRIELGEIESAVTSLPGIKQSVVIAGGQSADKHLLAYVILNEQGHESDGLSWKERWDAMYDIGADAKKELGAQGTNLDDTLLEHYQNASELALQSTEWLQSSISRIRELQSKRIYEIGSGAGQILFELAPQTDKYVATDYANTAIDKLNERLLAEPEQWKHVLAKTAPADDFSFVSTERFDLVLIHSVAQYFQHADYLLDVIRQSTKIIDNGCIFIGDMQGKNSLEMCHAIDHLPRASGEASVEEFKKVVLNRVRIEDEFVADPTFFYNLPKFIPEIKSVNVQLRKGQLLNETTRYHYDIWLYVGQAPAEAQAEIALDWDEALTLFEIEQLLVQNPKSVIEIRNALNSRTAKDLMLWQLIKSSPAETRLREINEKLSKGPEEINPQQLWDLAERFGFKAHIKWTTDGSDGLFDVSFIPLSIHAIPKNPYRRVSRLNDIYAFARTPFSGNEVSLTAERVENWKEALKKGLPSYMVPEAFIALKQFPLTANAKIDRKALPESSVKRSVKPAETDLPITKNEQFIANIWSEILGMDDIGIRDDFFELGGHSILAVKVMVRIEKETGQRIPIAAIFENPTVEKLARLIQLNKNELKFESLIPLKKSGNKTPVYVLHGGGLNVLTFNSIVQHMDIDQPVYGIQSLGLNGEEAPLYTIEALAEYYNQFILENDPDGPYLLAGYSFGGLLVYEMCRQLIALGKNVQKIVIIDTYVGDISLHSKPTGNKMLHKLFRQFNKLIHFGRLFLKDPVAVYDYQSAFVLSKINRLRGFTESSEEEEEALTYYTEIVKSYDVAYENYIMKPQDIQIDLFKVNKRIYFLDDPMYLGWRPFAKRGIKIHEVPGDHKTFMSAPNDVKFARILQKVLDNT